MTEPTPGPWTIRTVQNGCRCIVAPGNALVAEFFVGIREPAEGAHDECAANAQLAAGAKVMREALRRIATEESGWPAEVARRVLRETGLDSGPTRKEDPK